MFLTVERWSRDLREAQRGIQAVSFLMEGTEEKLRDYCAYRGLLLGQYAGCHGLDPADYFRRYGATERGVRRYLEARKQRSEQTLTADPAEFCAQLELSWSEGCDYVHALEIVSAVYGIRWQMREGTVQLGGYPLLPDGSLPPLYDLLTGWARFKPVRREERIVSLEEAIRGRPGSQRVPAACGAWALE